MDAHVPQCPGVVGVMAVSLRMRKLFNKRCMLSQ